VLHLLVSLLLAAILLLCKHTIINEYMMIKSERIEAASFVYVTTVLILIFTFITAPIKALFIARENIVYTSCIDVIDSMLKFSGALMLTHIAYDSLKVYAIFMASISMFAFSAYSIYAFINYEECHIPRISEISRQRMRQLFSFASWNLYAVGSTILRTQGLAIILNRFLGTVINAAYGISLQVSGAISSIASCILNAMNPQLMKAEGREDRAMMLKYATKESKYSFLILSCIMIPVVIEMPSILTVWLKDFPPYTVDFCRMIIIATILDQATIGLTSANQAGGNIRNYSLITSTIRLIIIPAAWFCLQQGLGITTLIGCYLLVELTCGLSRIPLIKYTAGLNVANYCRDVFLKPIVPLTGNVFISIVMTCLMVGPWRFIVTESAGVLVCISLTYCFSLDDSEKKWIHQHIAHRHLN
jgi:O-antigen/teichoic acid export membrane protein